MWSWVEKEEGREKEFISDQGVRLFLGSRPSSGIGPWLKDEMERV